MPIRPWTQVQSVDDDLLTLESAALLSLLAKYGTDDLSAFGGRWHRLEADLNGSRRDPARVTSAVLTLKGLLETTGLVLPNTLEKARGALPEAVFSEMATIVRGPIGQENGPRAAIALLNLLSEEPSISRQLAMGHMESGLVLKAWEHIHQCAVVLQTNLKQNIGPRLAKPLDDDWMAHDKDLLGDYTPWTVGIGPMFQTLAGWDSTWLMAKGIMQSELWSSISYWAPLPHLALGPLGWSDPAIGVARWILMGMPTETPELLILSRVWGADALMYFAHPQMDWVPQTHEHLGFQLKMSGGAISRLYESRESRKVFSSCGGLHMQTHLEWQLCTGFNEVVGEAHVYGREVNRNSRFVLELEKMAGWHTQLHAAGDKLAAEFPNLELEVTVIAPPVGFLGTYKRSRATGVWYSGSHEAHLLGHSNLNGPLRRLPSSVGLGATRPALNRSPFTGHTRAIAFWLASEMARRHPHYALSGKNSESLTLLSSAGPTIHILGSGALSVDGKELAGASEVLGTEDKRGLVNKLEEMIGLPRRRHAAPTTERTLIYRTMAHIAALLISDKGTWDFIAVDSKGPADAWQLNRDGEPVALLMPDGYVRIADRTINLLERYHFHGRRMTSTVGEVFGAVLP